MRQRLERFINHGVTELVIGILILFSVGLMILEVSFSPGTPRRELFAILGQAITWLFVITHPDPRIHNILPRRSATISPPNAESGGVSLETVYGHYLICGWNQSGAKMIRQLRANPETQAIPVVVIAHTLPEEWAQLAKDYLAIFFLAGDFVSIQVLRDAGVERARIAILLADKSLPRSDQDRDARTIRAALTIENH